MNDKTLIPIACTLTPQQMRDERQELLPGWIERAVSTRELENGLSLSFLPQAGVLRELVDMIEREQRCCSFLRFRLDVEPQMSEITLEVTGPPGTRELLLSWSSEANKEDVPRP